MILFQGFRQQQMFPDINAESFQFKKSFYLLTAHTYTGIETRNKISSEFGIRVKYHCEAPTNEGLLSDQRFER